MYNAGALDQLVEIHKKITIEDGTGGEEIKRLLRCKHWALVKDQGGGENNNFSKVTTLQNVVFIIRTDSTIETDDRIKHGGNEYEIKSIPPITRREFMEIKASLLDV